jgi:antitoxin component of MazEF toxin-antitoxin module
MQVMQLGVISNATLIRRVEKGDAEEGVLLGRDMLEAAGFEAGDGVEIHGDGGMLMLVPVRARTDDFVS